MVRMTRLREVAKLFSKDYDITSGDLLSGVKHVDQNGNKKQMGDETKSTLMGGGKQQGNVAPSGGRKGDGPLGCIANRAIICGFSFLS
jgi:hypothetical protein